jgi:zinc D-Ala-D-Ala carboxypeptidase
MRLSKNFSLRELTKSTTALRLGIDNNPTQEQLVNLTALTSCVLQPIRNTHGSVMINSGLRVQELNRTIGSKDSSQHTLGMAADIECPALDNLLLAKWIIGNLEFDQCILEFYTPDNPTSGWVHVSYCLSGVNRKNILRASRHPKKGVLYEEGLQ